MAYDEEHIDICKINLNSVLQNGQSIIVTTPFKVKIPSGDISRMGHVGVFPDYTMVSKACSA